MGGAINDDVFDNLLQNADIVLADLTDTSANVMYELGIRHCIGDRTIMIIEKNQEGKIPFFLQNYRIIPYSVAHGRDTDDFYQLIQQRLLYQLAACGRIPKKECHKPEERAMGRITRAKLHLPVEEVKERMNSDPRPLYRKRWLVIYNALVDPREAKDIAKHTGVSVKTVHKLISTYNRLGIAAVETPGKGGRRSEYMTFEEEKELLTPFFDRAKKGELTTTAQIKQEFEKKVGHKVAETTIYRILRRHEWRKLVPRPFHPKYRLNNPG